MFRKILSVVTAAIAGLALVGVAWASGSGVQGIASTGSQGTSTDSSLGASTPDLSGSISSSGTTGSSTPASTGAGVDSSTTSVSLVDTSSTSTSVPDSSTSTANEGTTGTSIDDDNREETRAPAPANAGPTTYEVGAGGTVTVQISGGKLILLDASAAPGWSAEVDRNDGEEIRLEFENGEDDAKFEARIHNGEMRVRVEPS